MNTAHAIPRTTTVSDQRVHTVVPSPVGDLILVARGGSLVGLYIDGQRHLPMRERLGDRDDGPQFDDARTQLREYFAGERTAFDLPLAPQGDAFKQRVWALLREIPYGQTRSYGDLARELGDRNLAQAVGTANGRNPIAIVVPCHRVIGADGSLTGYAGGLERKRFLLDHEAKVAGTWSKLF